MPDPVAPDDITARHAHRSSQSRLIGIAVSGSANNALLISMIPLFLLSLGASPILIGLGATSTNIQKMGRILGLQLMHRMEECHRIQAA